MSNQKNKSILKTCTKQFKKKQTQKQKQKTKNHTHHGEPNCKNSIRIPNERKRKQMLTGKDSNEEYEETVQKKDKNRSNQTKLMQSQIQEEETYKRARLILTRVVKKKKIKIDDLSENQVEKIQKKRNRRNARRFRKRKKFYIEQLEEESKNLKITNKCLQIKLEQTSNENLLLQLQAQKLQEQLKQEQQSRTKKQKKARKQKRSFQNNDSPKIRPITKANSLGIEEKKTRQQQKQKQKQKQKQETRQKQIQKQIQKQKQRKSKINSKAKITIEKINNEDAITKTNLPKIKFSEINNSNTIILDEEDNMDLSYYHNFDPNLNSNNSLTKEDLDLFSFSKFESDDFLLKNIDALESLEPQWL
ncbi:bzip transcription factor [Anaeramoeba flamelloides]|uniref:Bzip transcription factor n=1 Tax=Anaeramoeba flamelloides TaxID=1746091 RepID=A0ABQ8YYC3_9EUKA|nr:bzip transcription factor [Anaeramoeba flamelloides]